MSISKAYILAGLLALAGASSSHAGGIPTVLIEGAVETTANELSLPAAEAGIITVRACPTCSTQTFYFGKERQLFLDGKLVSLAQMSAALRIAGDAPVTLHYRRKDQVVTRIVFVVPRSSAQ